ncbi:MAG: trypsin-like peptidase domain-containing protein [Myxococcota bacterium]
MRAAALVLASSAFLACPSERLPGYYDPVPLADGAAVSPAAGTPDAGSAPSGDAGTTGSTSATTAMTAPDAGHSAPSGPSDDPMVPSFVGLFRRLKPSVVNIYTQEIVANRIPGFVPLPLPDGDPPMGTSLGSGMILDEEGHILTNAHVVENAAEIRVRFADESELPARLVGLDPVRDLAVLKVDGAAMLVPVERGDSDRLQVGDWVIAIGNPFGLSHTITKGIVSGKGRSEFVNDRVGYLDLIQTDAAINQGSSGGPLFDMQGRVVGINTAVNAEGHGIGFAIGWNAVEEALPRLMQGGQVSRSWLGVYVKQEDGDEEGEGRVVVDAVVDDSPAAKAGMLPGDVVLALDQRQVHSVAEFRLRVASAVAGRDMRVDIERRGLPLQLAARLEEARDIR